MEGLQGASIYCKHLKQVELKKNAPKGAFLFAGRRFA
jgi:hypothetical protein